MHLFTRRHPEPTGEQPDRPGGVLLDRGWRYDVEVWLFDTFVMRGQIRRLRQRVLALAQVGPGGRLLDVGCGTGTLAIEAARLMGPGAGVAGIEPAPRQIARARAKARRAALDIDFRAGVIEELPFDDQCFDAVTSTLMIHHLAEESKAQGLVEVHRVLRPQGRLVIADFDASSGHSHGGDTPGGGQSANLDLTGLVVRAGFTEVTTEQIPFARKHHGWSGATVLGASRP